MPDRSSPKTERRLQRWFRKTNIFNYLTAASVALAVMAFDHWLKSVEVRSDGPARQASLRFNPVSLSQAGFAPLRLEGAWEVEVDDPRFGGISALTVDGSELLALTDSGTLVRFPKPGRGRTAFIRDLPSGPGIPQFKVNRDSEALARDPAGRGWWIAFEFRHQLWLYDPGFRRSLARIDLGENRWPDNQGLEAIAPDADGLLLFPEPGDEWLRIGSSRLRSGSMANSYGDVADAVRLQDGRLLLVTRRFGLGGIVKNLVEVQPQRAGLALRPIAALGLGPKDNVEAIAAEPRTGGGTQLWLMTDNDFRPRKTTLLVALDLP